MAVRPAIGFAFRRCRAGLPSGSGRRIGRGSIRGDPIAGGVKKFLSRYSPIAVTQLCTPLIGIYSHDDDPQIITMAWLWEGTKA